MKKPEQPWKPNKYDFKLDSLIYPGGTEKVFIYSDYLPLDDNCRDFLCEECEDEGCEECPIEPNPNHRNIEAMTLQDIIDLIPRGYGPSDVGMGLDFIRTHGIFTIDFHYNRKINIEAQEKLFKKAQEKYKKDLAKYELEYEKYSKWEKEQEITKLKERLEELES
jgi:hypothetical protein